MFAIIRIGPAQYKVSVGDVIEVARMPGEVGEVLSLSDVLLFEDDKKIKVGKPTVKRAAVEAKIEAHYKGDKIEIRRFKSKVRERKHIGFRSQRTRLLITAIHA